MRGRKNYKKKREKKRKGESKQGGKKDMTIGNE